MKSLCTYCFRNLGVGSRLRIYNYLAENDSKNVTDITDYIGLKQPTVSYHLKEMLDSGLLEREGRGKEVFYSARKLCPHDKADCIISLYVEN